MTIFGATGIEVFHFFHQRSCERKKKETEGERETEIEARGREREREKLRLRREGEREKKRERKPFYSKIKSNDDSQVFCCCFQSAIK